MSNFYRSNLDEGNEISMATSPFFTDRVFESREELMQWVQNTTFSLGYIIVTRRSKAKENGVVSYVTLICDCGGEYKFKELSKKSGTKKTNCSYLKQYDGWMLRVICDQHNHPPAQHMEGHAYARQLKENKKKLLVDLTSKNVTSRDILLTLKEQDENNVSTLKTIYNVRKKLFLEDFLYITNIYIHSGVLKYLDLMWLSKYKEMFVSVWIDRHLNFREQTTNRVESQHAKLKKYLCAKNSAIDKFVGCINQIVKSQLTSIYESFEKSRIVLKQGHNLLCFRLLRGFVALEAIDILEGELQQSSRHQLDSSNYVCKLRHSFGLPCACMLSIYLNSGECIPLDSIDLDLSPSNSVGNEDICCDGELEMFKENFTNLLRKLRDIFQPSKTLIKELTIQKNTQAPRRRSHSTMSKSVGLDLVELNKEPTRHISDFIDLNQMPESCDTHPLIKEILDMFHPYITHIQDVRGDGNCGFRAIYVCLGYGEDQWLYVGHQLLDELLSSYDIYARVFTDGIDELRNSLYFSQSSAPAEHWMVMPMTGVLIANKFVVIFNYLTKRGDITFFPLWRGPEHFQYHHAISIAHVYDNHNVMVQLEGDYPMPTISAYWIHHKAPSTAG
ncbi:hypothetical protein GOBAR_AA04341 [Gossypium barbadense]|uniref:Uncharacterized protein n=1 Tax=Gossypium barbadense TaxID=3634 RepID=A0A2P5YKX8_GOSBA|nr:hypothetical protein GOBAR_AA04341 [Gossypium barbadense]